MAVLDRLKRGWNAFVNGSTQTTFDFNHGPSSSIRQDRTRRRFSNERSIITSIYTRMSMDFAGISLRHVQYDELDRYLNDVDSSLNDILLLEPNLDQGPRSFRQDLALTLFDHGAAAIVPVDMEIDKETGQTLEIISARIGTVVTWYPRMVKVNLYNETKGIKEDVLLEKRKVAIVENPFYGIMNEPNSILQRLIRKLTILDAIDEASSPGKLDLIIQVPYVVKSEAQKANAKQRIDNIQMQLKTNTHGIAYTDGTEKIIQLNRSIENKLLPQIEFLFKMLYGELGITEGILNGSADEKEMINYYNRTIEPLLEASAEAIQRTLIDKKKVKSGERIRFFRDPFRLAPISDLAAAADIFSRNEILAPNEIRGFMGIPRSTDPEADKLKNSNMPQMPSLDSGFVEPEQAALPAGDIDEDVELLAQELEAISEEMEGLV